VHAHVEILLQIMDPCFWWVARVMRATCVREFRGGGMRECMKTTFFFPFMDFRGEVPRNQLPFLVISSHLVDPLLTTCYPTSPLSLS